MQNAKEILRLGKTHIIFVFFCELFARLFVTFAIYYLFSDDDAAAGANALKLTIDKIDRSLAMPLFRTIPKDNILKKSHVMPASLLFIVFLRTLVQYDIIISRNRKEMMH